MKEIPTKLSSSVPRLLGRARWFIAASALAYVVATQAQSPNSNTPYRAPASVGLDAYLDLVAKNNAKVQAANLRKEAAKQKARSGDLEALPFLLTGGAGYSSDGQETSMPTQQGTHTKGKQYTLGISKTFATGTKASATWTQAHSQITGSPIPAGWESKYGFELSQSLLKNSFGHATRLRHAREDAQTQIATLKAESEARQALIGAEEVYWTYVMQTIDVKERAESLKRVQRTRNWIAKRLDNGIADRADLLQVDSLVAQTKLGQLDSQNKLEAARKAFVDAMGTTPSAELLPSTNGLDTVRPLATKNETLQRVDIWIGTLAAQAAETGAREAADLTRPDLSVSGAFGANARDADFGSSTGDAIGSDNNYYRVALQFGMSLDFGLQNKVRSAARAEAQAARMESDQISKSLGASWDELVRQHRDLSATIALMEELTKTMEAKLKREQERLELGRTVTANVVTFEQELADARLRLLQTKVGQRKVEAMARMFLSKTEVEAL